METPDPAYTDDDFMGLMKYFASHWPRPAAPVPKNPNKARRKARRGKRC